MAKTTVITGASSGIGAATATALAARGDQVVLAARRKDELHQLAARLGPHVMPVVTDVTSRAAVERLRDEAIERFGAIDVWVNNAGRGISRLVGDLTDDELDQMMTVNVKSALYGIQAVLPHFQARGTGQIVNVSSFLSRVPMASIRAAYSASKAASTPDREPAHGLAATPRGSGDARDARPRVDRVRQPRFTGRRRSAPAPAAPRPNRRTSPPSS
jgi:NADP-dependent 3-hydroxy acid dehydrogenase YdfG